MRTYDWTVTKPLVTSGKNIWGPGPSSFGRQQRLHNITLEPQKLEEKIGGLGKVWGPVFLAQHRTTSPPLLVAFVLCSIVAAMFIHALNTLIGNCNNPSDL